jgi:hypothetical protein
MEQEKLPNATLILVFGIVSIVTCCCYGVLGLIFGIIAVILANKAKAIYLENPEQYSGYQNVKIGNILAIIGIVLNLLYMIYVIVLFSKLGMDGIMEMNQRVLEEYGV